MTIGLLPIHMSVIVNNSPVQTADCQCINRLVTYMTPYKFPKTESIIPFCTRFQTLPIPIGSCMLLINIQ